MCLKREGGARDGSSAVESGPGFVRFLAPLPHYVGVIRDIVTGPGARLYSSLAVGLKCRPQIDWGNELKEGV